jgi:hypothetical protein
MGSRRFVFALAGLAVLVCVVAVIFTRQPGLASIHDDSVSYLLMAQSYSPFGTASAPVRAAAALEKYPPVFPLMLAWSGSAFDWPRAHALVAACFAIGVFAFGLHIRETSGSEGIAFLTALTYAALPGTWLNVKGILSEFPFMALTFATLLACARLRAAGPGWRAVAIPGLLLGAVVLTRTIGVALLAAFTLAQAARFARERDIGAARRAACSVGIAVALASLWYALRPSAGEDAYAASALGVVERADRQGLASIASLLSTNISSLVDAWLNVLMIYWGEPWQGRFVLGCLLGLAGAAATAWRAARAEPDGVYCALFVAILVVWPYPGQMYRLLLPVVPLVLASAWWALGRLLEKRFERAVARRIATYAAALPLAFCVPALFYIAERAQLPQDESARYRRNDIVDFYRIPFRTAAEAGASRQVAAFEDMDRIRASTPESARVMWYGPGYIALLAGRFGVALDPPADAADMASQVRRSRPDYLYLSHVHPRDSAHRMGDPIAPVAFVAGYTQPVWLRRSDAQALDSILLKVDPDRAEVGK